MESSIYEPIGTILYLAFIHLGVCFFMFAMIVGGVKDARTDTQFGGHIIEPKWIIIGVSLSGVALGWSLGRYL